MSCSARGLARLAYPTYYSKPSSTTSPSRASLRPSPGSQTSLELASLTFPALLQASAIRAQVESVATKFSTLGSIATVSDRYISSSGSVGSPELGSVVCVLPFHIRTRTPILRRWRIYVKALIVMSGITLVDLPRCRNARLSLIIWTRT